MDNWPVLGRLRRAVHKVRFLLNFDLHRWIFTSRARGPTSKRLLSFSDRPGLRACASMDNKEYEYSPSSLRGSGLQRTMSYPSEDDKEYDDSPGSLRGSGLQRTTSYPSEDDVDKRADMFIANFHRQLQLERQISMELRYCRGSSFVSRSP